MDANIKFITTLFEEGALSFDKNFPVALNERTQTKSSLRIDMQRITGMKVLRDETIAQLKSVLPMYNAKKTAIAGIGKNGSTLSGILASVIGSESVVLSDKNPEYPTWLSKDTEVIVVSPVLATGGFTASVVDGFRERGFKCELVLSIFETELPLVKQRLGNVPEGINIPSFEKGRALKKACENISLFNPTSVVEALAEFGSESQCVDALNYIDEMKLIHSINIKEKTTTKLTKKAFPEEPSAAEA